MEPDNVSNEKFSGVVRATLIRYVFEQRGKDILLQEDHMKMELEKAVIRGG
jgi:argonaute-like protein implicated in RNA metabolism and viral defense